MIDYSPQELIAQSMFNCYCSHENQRGFLQNAKSMPRAIRNFCSPRKNDKISLKKAPSIAKDSTKLTHTVSQKQIPNQIRIQTTTHHAQTIYRIVPQQKVIEYRINPTVPHRINQQKITRTRPVFTYQNVQHVHKIQPSSHCIRFDRRQQSVNKMSSTLQTAHSSGSFDNYQLNLIPPKTDKNYGKTALQIQQIKHADKKQLINFEPTLSFLKPRITESQFDGSEVFQDQFSEVISTYYSSAKQMQNKN